MTTETSDAGAARANENHPIGATLLPSVPSKARLEALSDGIFAVVMTLLVLDIKLPELSAGANSGQVWAALLHVWPKIVAFVISFSFLARAWNAHRTIFHFVEHADYAFSYLNTLFLLFVCFLPFTTSMISEHPRTSPGAVLYAINLIVLPAIVYAMWHRAVAVHLLDREQGPAAAAWAIDRHRLVLAAMGPALPIAFFYSELAILWILCWHIFFDVRPFFVKPTDTTQHQGK